MGEYSEQTLHNISELNFDAIPNYLMYQYCPTLGSLFKKKIMPVVQIKEKISQDNTKQIEFNLLTLLHENISKRTKHRATIGVFLSGGLDSSLIAALCSQHTKLHAFTAVFRTHTEISEATAVSRHLGMIPHHIEEILPEKIANDIFAITKAYGEPLGDAALINNYYLTKAASKFTDTIFTGDGGDEVFGGYPWHHFEKYISIANKVPVPIREIGQKLFNNGDLTGKLNRVNRIALFPLQTSLDKMIMYPTTCMSHQNLRWLLKENNYKHLVSVPGKYNSLYNTLLAFDCANLLKGKFGLESSRFEKALGVKRYSPLSEDNTIDFAFTIPTYLKRDKKILKGIAKNLLPDSTLKRKKQGFGTPISDWFNNDIFRQLVLDRLENGELLKKICKEESLVKLIGYFKKNARSMASGMTAISTDTVIWNLFALQIWYDVFFGEVK